MKTKRLLAGVFLGLLAACATTPTPTSNVPLPQEIVIIPPSSDLPPEVAAFSGRWEGDWESDLGSLESILIVEEIDRAKAKVIYAWGGREKGYSRCIAKVIPDSRAKIEFGGEGRPKFTFEMGKDFKSIRGIREFRDRYAKITMKRAEK